MTGPQPVSGAQAKRLAIMVPLAAAVLAFAANLSGAAPEIDMPRVLAGTVILMVILAVLAEGAPSISAGFAWVILVTAFFVTGEPAWRALASLTGNNSDDSTSTNPNRNVPIRARNASEK